MVPTPSNRTRSRVTRIGAADWAAWVWPAVREEASRSRIDPPAPMPQIRTLPTTVQFLIVTPTGRDHCSPSRRDQTATVGVAVGAGIGRAVVVEALQTPAFQADVAAARAELEAARRSGLTNPGCAAERAALATVLP